jgi:hypothetical protein
VNSPAARWAWRHGPHACPRPGPWTRASPLPPAWPCTPPASAPGLLAPPCKRPAAISLSSPARPACSLPSPPACPRRAWRPADYEQASDLPGGITITAERLRYATHRFARPAGWAPAATSASWRKNALAAAITCHAGEHILRTLSERATQLNTGPAISTQLTGAAAAMNRTWPAWQAIAHHFDTITTGAQPGAPTGPVTTELADLVLRTGRLAYDSQRWTPARGQATRLRRPADLAPAVSDLVAAIGALHTAADAITCIATADQQAAQAAAGAGHLYLPRARGTRL